MTAPLRERVIKLAKLFDKVVQLPEVDVTIEKVGSEELEELRNKRGCPKDLLLILESIGCVRDFGRNGGAVIDWWVPCSIEKANKEERCPYEPDPRLIKNADKLLFFAWDCDALIYFYDISSYPWQIVSTDGLTVSLEEQNYVEEDWTVFETWNEDVGLIELIQNLLE